MTDSPGWAAPDAPGPDDPRRSPRSPAEAAASDEEAAREPANGTRHGEGAESDRAPERADAATGPYAADAGPDDAPRRLPEAPRSPESPTDARPPAADPAPSAETPAPGRPGDTEAAPQPVPATGGEADAPPAEPASDTPPAATPPSTSATPPGWAAGQPPAAPGGWGAPGGHPPSGGWGAPGNQAPGWGPPQGSGTPGWGAPRGWQGPYLPAKKPGIIPLRPLGVGELLDGAVAAMRAHWKVMIGLSLVVALITQTIVVPIQWSLLHDVDTSVLDESDPSADELRDVLVPLLGSSAVLLVVMLLGQLIITGILTLVVSRAVLGKDMTLGQAWSGTRPLLLRLLGTSVMTFVIPALLFAACLVPGVLLALIAGEIGGALIVLGIFGGGALAVYAYVLLQLSSPALILEKQTVRKALARSRKLVTGSWWRVLGITLLIALLTAIISSIVQLPFSLGTGFSQFGATPDSFLDSVILGIGTVVSYGLTFPFSAAALVLLYIDQRMRREALDLELARAAGLVPDDAPAAS
ncbi:hypothetical protein LO772_21810 [Yinghuangia sp. ASG 101]|uniref:hypothetical protein n=1 Tax=Yinghuangia sp. ASG 101 TaxID=2896848 RepID=UPI001E587F30|nr:hypothetical protein [Yinghuangia sp. ASG 101]UGQ09557.1 hypothetical protein LO772_21810 [Yinghuangia sp. ASG 101]